MVGLITAIDNFDPAQNVKLKTYAEYKIRGAILDSLRGLDWAPRQKRKKAKQIEAAITQAEQRLHRAPTEEDVAAELAITLDEYHEWLVEIRGVNIGSLEYAEGEDEGRDLLQFISDDEEDWPSSLLERAELEKAARVGDREDARSGAQRTRPLLSRGADFARDRHGDERCTNPACRN